MIHHVYHQCRFSGCFALFNWSMRNLFQKWLPLALSWLAVTLLATERETPPPRGLWTRRVFDSLCEVFVGVASFLLGQSTRHSYQPRLWKVLFAHWYTNILQVISCNVSNKSLSVIVQSFPKKLQIYKPRVGASVSFATITFDVSKYGLERQVGQTS